MTSLTLHIMVKVQQNLLTCGVIVRSRPSIPCRLILSCSAGAFFLLVFAIFRGKIQVFRTRLVCPQ